MDETTELERAKRLTGGPCGTVRFHAGGDGTGSGIVSDRDPVRLGSAVEVTK